MNESVSTGLRDPVQRYLMRRARQRWVIIGAVFFLIGLAIYWGIVAEVPTEYADIRDHFKYGSIGSEAGAGIPYWIWWVLPEAFPQHLPEPERFQALPAEQRNALAGYKQFGFVHETGHDLPIGFTKRRATVERVGLNCAVCHVGTVKVDTRMNPQKIYGAEPSYTSVEKDRVIILGMPAITVDLHEYIMFLHKCGQDAEFTVENILNKISARVKLGPIDRFIYKQAVPRVRDALQEQAERLNFLYENPKAGPGRVDTFNPYKRLVFYFPPDHSIGNADLPSLWNQRPREGLHLHWDGDNTSVFERNISASMGAGATPVSLDMPRMLRVANWLGAPDPHRDPSLAEIEEARANPVPRPGELPIPKYPFPIDEILAARGGAIYKTYCASCHDWKGQDVGQVLAIDKIGTDRQRLDSFTEELAVNQNTLGAGQWWRFHHFRKTNGYVNMPLDGLWARAPYLHNGSVPTLRDLLNEPPKQPGANEPGKRPAGFHRGDDAYDPMKVGFRSDRECGDDGRKLFWFDTAVKGNGNGGHQGRVYGTELSEEEKEALVEYLKKL